MIINVGVNSIFDKNLTYVGVTTKCSPIESIFKIMKIIFIYTHANTSF